jgi:hypothetical protein
MGVGCMVITETKLTDDRYPRFILGYHVIALKAASPHQGRIAVLWKPGHQDFEVEAVHVASPNTLMFQLVMGGVQFFVMGAYIPPADTMGVDDIRAAWAKCPANCKPLLLGDLNINLKVLQTKREEIIADLLDEMNFVNRLRKFVQQRGQGQGRGVQWTWRQQRGGHWHQSQPDYCMARDADAKLIRNVTFQQPRLHTLDHHAVVVSLLRGRHGQLKQYRQRCQTFPLQLPLVEEQDKQTRLFGDLQKTCKNTPARWKDSDWILEESWRLIAHWAMLHRTGRLCQMGGRHLHCQISASLCKDRVD